MSWLNSPLFLACTACVMVQLLAWLMQMKTKNADVVDIAWTLGIILCAGLYLWLIPSANINALMVMMFPVVWYLRLLFHLILRFDVHHEDGRYLNLRNHWDENTQFKFLMFFMFQAMLSVLFSLTAYWVLLSPEMALWQMVTAMILGLTALVGVSTADHQLLRFKKTHDSSEVCDVGLWQYSRHPNYFFEWLHWFVYPILLWNSGYFWWSLLVVLMMLLFLLKLTGIPFSEQQALKKRGAAYQAYMNKTSPFILWRPNDD
ncbi:DUF1295 domain-containing protein [Marinicella litoralis]|nr:DUF1295 domain-containing protein [Marinicella litoralis]